MEFARRTADRLTPDEVAAVRHAIRRNTVDALKPVLSVWGLFFLIFLGYYVFDGRRHSGNVQVGFAPFLAGAAALLLLACAWRARRLRGRRGLDELLVCECETPMAPAGRCAAFGRLFSADEVRRNRRTQASYKLHFVDALCGLDPGSVYRLRLVEVLRGPDRYFVVRAEPVRAATAADREDLVRHLWGGGVYDHLDP